VSTSWQAAHNLVAVIRRTAGYPLAAVTVRLPSQDSHREAHGGPFSFTG
jgi:hypothetical protein